MAVLVFTGIDYLINGTLADYGLKYADSWFWTYQILYTALWQVAIIMLTLYSRSKRFFFVSEAFVLSGVQDLFYFAFWNGGAFPPGIWTWTIPYHFFGLAVTTVTMVFVGALAVSGATAFMWVLNPDKAG